MSILACLIGILTLMISVSMQVQQMEHEGKTEEELDRAIANRDLKQEAIKIDQDIKNLEQQLKKDHSTVAELQKIKDKRIALTLELKELKKAKDPENSDAALQKLLENLKKEIAALKQERPPISKKRGTQSDRA